MENIFDISNFSSSNAYSVNDIVLYNGRYRYALTPKAAGIDFVESAWGGVAEDQIDGTVKPHFFWKPSYGDDTSKEPKVKVIKFGDSYEQRIKDGISNSLLSINYTFEKRSLAEGAAILHFLEVRNAVEAFLFEPHIPYRKQKRFVCRSWRSSTNFYDNYTIRTTFEEVPA